MKKYSLLAGIALILTGVVALPVYALEVDPDDGDIVVEPIEIIGDNTDEESIDDVVFIDEEDEEVIESEEEQDIPLADVDNLEPTEPETFEIIADIDSGDDTSTSIIVDHSDITLLNTAPTDSKLSTEEGIENHVLVTNINEILVDNTVLTTSTYFTDSSGTEFFSTSTTALGVLTNALRQHDIDITIEGGGGYYVSDINGYTASGYDGWKYSVDQIEGGIGINNIELLDGESLQVFYGVWPWKITSDVSTTTIGQDITFSTWEYATSTQHWDISPSTTISINDLIVSTNGLGTYVFTPTSTATTTAFVYDGTSDWPQNSPYIEVMVFGEVQTVHDTAIPYNTNGGGPGIQTSNDFSPTDAEIQAAVDALMEYTALQLGDDGDTFDGGTLDWLVMSFAAYEKNPYEVAMTSSSLMDYSLDYTLDGPTNLNQCTGYSLHIMALLAGGVDATDASIAELETHMLTYCYTGHSYGLDTLNDDAFALISLLATGHTAEEEIMIDLIHNIETSQTKSGMFVWPWGGGSDLTGLALNSLVYAQDKGMDVDQTVIDNSKKFLKDTQLPDGGWGDYESTDLLTTSWIMMGLNALGESQRDWLTDDGYTPWNPLVAAVNDEGYYESAWTPGPDWFSMKHAVPALLGLPWPIISNFEPPEPDDEIILPTPPPGPGYTPTTTEQIARTTLDIVTSTEDIVEETSTTTETIAVEEGTTTDEEKVEPTSLAIGGRLEDFVEVKPTVAGVKIAQPVLVAEDLPKELAPNIDDPIILGQNDDDDEQEKITEQPNTNTFKISLGLTVFLAGLLGWRILKSLL